MSLSYLYVGANRKGPKDKLLRLKRQTGTRRKEEKREGEEEDLHETLKTRGLMPFGDGVGHVSKEVPIPC